MEPQISPPETAPSPPTNKRRVKRGRRRTPLGRPLKLTRDLATGICAVLAMGGEDEDAAAYADVSLKSVQRWLKRGELAELTVAEWEASDVPPSPAEVKAWRSTEKVYYDFCRLSKQTRTNFKLTYVLNPLSDEVKNGSQRVQAIKLLMDRVLHMPAAPVRTYLSGAAGGPIETHNINRGENPLEALSDTELAAARAAALALVEAERAKTAGGE